MLFKFSHVVSTFRVSETANYRKNPGRHLFFVSALHCRIYISRFPPKSFSGIDTPRKVLCRHSHGGSSVLNHVGPADQWLGKYCEYSMTWSETQTVTLSCNDFFRRIISILRSIIQKVSSRRDHNERYDYVLMCSGLMSGGTLTLRAGK